MLILVKPLKCSYIFFATLGILTLYFFLVRILNKTTFTNRTEIDIDPTTKYVKSNKKNHFHFKGDRIVHLDLKGAPPKISYYRRIFPLLSQLGATGLLLEYEDMFPFSGKLSNISALNAYSSEDILIINKLAKTNNLKIIPLIQIFTHLEFILKLADFKKFREVPSYPQVICPLHEDTGLLLVTMIEQIVKAHPQLDMIHIGTDEVYYLGQCSRCYNYLQDNHISKNLLFLNHVKNVTSIVKIMFPKLRILMWDNQLRSVSSKELKETGLNTKVEPVVWKYNKDVYEDLGPTFWERYGKTFQNVWAASAFKGPTDGNQFLSHFTNYLLNQMGWLSIFEEYENAVHFEGIILTGWQRYDHFAVLSELLPVTIPSLAMSLRLISGHIDPPLNPPSHIARVLHCKQPYALLSPAFGSPKCSYPGGDILEYVIQLHQLIQEFDAIVEDTKYTRWMSQYNIKFSFANPSQIESVTSLLNKIKNDLTVVDTDITSALSEVYDNYTVDEWRDTYIQPFKLRVQAMWEARKRLLMKDTWPRRPLIKNEL